MPSIPSIVTDVIEGGRLSGPQIYERNQKGNDFEIFVAIWNAAPKPNRTDLNFIDANFVSLPMTNSPVKRFEILEMRDARTSFLKGHPASKMYKPPRESHVFVFTTDRDVDYFVIAKQMRFEIFADPPGSEIFVPKI